MARCTQSGLCSAWWGEDALARAPTIAMGLRRRTRQGIAVIGEPDIPWIMDYLRKYIEMATPHNMSTKEFRDAS
jgi:hypothetical protein